jgi:hypothetical protein
MSSPFTLKIIVSVCQVLGHSQDCSHGDGKLRLRVTVYLLIALIL